MALAAGARAAPPRLPRVAARAAATDRTRDPAVPHHRRGLRAADRDPADRGAVRGRPVRPAPVAQDRAQRAVVAGVRRAAAGPLAPRLARGVCGALDAGGDCTAGAVVVRQQVRGGTGTSARGLTANLTRRSESTAELGCGTSCVRTVR